MQEPSVILVDENDNELGTMFKLEAHQKGLLHRAISVFLFDTNGKWILQKRSENKYHSANLWTNACCSHPLPNEETEAAAHRRLLEEMGLSCSLTKVLSFVYKAELDQDLIEHEFDHVFVGYTSKLPIINTQEASGYKIVPFEVLDNDVQMHPHKYTKWFKLIYKKVNLHINLSKNYIKN